MVLLVGVFTFTLDTGYLFTTESRYQNAVDAAALAGAAGLCTEDVTGITVVVKDILLANGLSLANNLLTVETGFYDEGDYYDDFDTYADFVTARDMPDDEFINAVCVTYTSKNIGLTGLNPGATIIARAVAYLQRIDIASLDTKKGEIHLGHKSVWGHTVFFSNGDIKYPEMVSGKGEAYDTPTFNDCKRLAAGEVLECPAQVTTNATSVYISVQWDTGTPQSGDDIRTQLDPVTGIRPVDDETLDYWRRRADIIYTPDQAGQDDVFPGIGYHPLMGDHYFVDPASESGGSQRVIFFDTGDNTDMPVVIGPCLHGLYSFTHTPNGYTITNLVFVATCPIHIINLRPKNSSNQAVPALHVGGEGKDQAVFISTEDITIYPEAGKDVIFDGTVFRTGKDFILYEGGVEDQSHRIRIISDGDIYGVSHPAYTDDQGLNMKNDSRFGPPCPPLLPRLGRLVDGDW
jgi:hypothetical protein